MHIRKRERKAPWLAVCAVLIVFTVMIGEAQGNATYPGDRDIIFSVQFSPGGAYDSYTRALAPLLEEYLPGNPTVLVVNKPGAGGLIAATDLYTRAPDGYEIQILNVANMTANQIVRGDSRFDVRRYEYLGRVGFDHYLPTVAPESPLTTLESMRTAPHVTIGTAGVFDTSAITAVIVYSALGVDFTLVPHDGCREAVTAAIRGDVDVVHCGYGTARPFIDNGDLRVLVQFTDTRVDGLEEVPTIAELGYGELTNKTMFQFAIATTPGTPSDRVEILRKAVWSALNDPRLEEWSIQAQRPLAILDHEDTFRLVLDEFESIQQNRDLLSQMLL